MPFSNTFTIQHMASLAHQPSTPTPQIKQLIAVVGAGLSGLHCCKTVQKIVKAIIVMSLIEAQNAVGGRTRAIKVNNDTIVDLGSSWIHMQ